VREEDLIDGRNAQRRQGGRHAAISAVDEEGLFAVVDDPDVDRAAIDGQVRGELDGFSRLNRSGRWCAAVEGRSRSGEAGTDRNSTQGGPAYAAEELAPRKGVRTQWHLNRRK